MSAARRINSAELRAPLLNPVVPPPLVATAQRVASVHAERAAGPAPQRPPESRAGAQLRPDPVFQSQMRQYMDAYAMILSGGLAVNPTLNWSW